MSRDGLKYFQPQMFSPRYGLQIFTYSMTPGNKVDDDSCCSLQCETYTIHVKQGNVEWSVVKRFSDFLRLHSILQEKYSTIQPFPLFPPKTLFPELFCSQKFMTNRLNMLNIYLENILLSMSSKNLLQGQNPLLEWLELKL